MDAIPEIAQRFGVLLLELLALFVVVSFLVAVVQQRWLGPERMQRILGGSSRSAGLVKGALFGALTPFCSCAGIPLLIGGLRAGVPFPAAAAFLLASPLLNPVILGVITLLFGWQLALGYAVVTFPATVLVAAIWDRLGFARFVKIQVAEPAPSIAQAAPAGAIRGRGGAVAAAATSGGCGNDVCGADESGPDPVEQRVPWAEQVRRGWQETMGNLRPVVLPMGVAVAVGAVIYGIVPDEFLVRVAGSGNPLAVPMAAAIGVPLYVRGEAALPIGAALMSAGVGIGPVFAMVIGAAGASLPEMALLSGVVRRGLLVAFVLSVFSVAIAGGLLIPLFA